MDRTPTLFRRRLVLLLTATLLGACSAVRPSVEDEVLCKHVLMFDRDGYPVYPPSKYHEWAVDENRMTAAELKLYVERMLQSFDEFRAEVAARPGSDDDEAILTLFVHGGMNSHEDTLERVTAEVLEAAKRERRYPIYVSWDCPPVSSYVESLFAEAAPTGYVTAPYTVLLPLAADIVSSVVMSPRDLLTQQARVAEEDEGTYLIERALSQARAIELLPQPPQPPQEPRLPNEPPLPRIVEGTGDYSPPDDLSEWARDFRWWVMTPARLLTTVFFDRPAQGAWQSMLRRARVLFDHDRFLGHPDPDEFCQGGLLYFFLQAEKRQLGLETGSSSKPSFKVDLVAHSMGAIILNGVIEFWLQHRRVVANVAPTSTDAPSPDPAESPGSRGPRIDNIVFLGAACSIRDYQNAVFPFMNVLTEKRSVEATIEAWENDPHQWVDAKPVDRTRMIHVVLHPSDELRESHMWDAVQRGTLLVWIDDYYEEPRLPLDRTAGRFENLLQSLWMTPSDLAGQVFVKVLDGGKTGGENDPHRHGDLDDGRFWRFIPPR